MTQAIFVDREQPPGHGSDAGTSGDRLPAGVAQARTPSGIREEVDQPLGEGLRMTAGNELANPHRS